MASTRELADTLPFYPPEPEGDTGHDSIHDHFPAYTLVPLDHDGQQRFLKDLNTGDMTTSNCILAPQPDFAGRKLRDIYDYHIEASKEDNKMHPDFFIVADQEDWATKGVLVVYLHVERQLLNMTTKSLNPNQRSEYCVVESTWQIPLVAISRSPMWIGRNTRRKSKKNGVVRIPSRIRDTPNITGRRAS